MQNASHADPLRHARTLLLSVQAGKPDLFLLRHSRAKPKGKKRRDAPTGGRACNQLGTSLGAFFFFLSLFLALVSRLAGAAASLLRDDDVRRFWARSSQCRCQRLPRRNDLPRSCATAAGVAGRSKVGPCFLTLFFILLGNFLFGPFHGNVFALCKRG